MDFLLPDFKSMALLLKKHKVNFMLIGGYAVIYYGYNRSTGDMDIWLEPSNSNKEKFISALKEFGINEAGISKVNGLNFTEQQAFYFGQVPERIDFLTRINNVTFDEAIKSVNHFPLENEQVPIIQYHHLILSKISNDRLKDKADVEELQRINKHRYKLD